ncbi:hypothetical protein C8N24_6507 [Solirubrobacter pauli]|uniref:Uncharacterized protein n=1 Tax=Solirubrobacter pauli TaxID=166793 RepID=A0A660L1Z7_9ACTN|nr:hypothetical protein [Solirubrobacter pauli]RKQ84877.1 hypothetical protein C8N24_6507 [Solirubrobacter pauli]
MTVRVLALLVRLLARDGWGRAMLAEVAALEEPRAQRRFALGCVGALLTRSASWLRISGVLLVAAVPTLLFAGPGGSGDVAGLAIAGTAIAVCLVAVVHVEQMPVVARAACAGGCLWWAGLLASEAVRSHPQWALALLAACVAAAAWRGGLLAALGAAFVTCLAIFVVAVGTYAVLPQLAPAVAPANAVHPVIENQIESTDPYVGELLLAALFGIVLIAAIRTTAGPMAQPPRNR